MIQLLDHYKITKARVVGHDIGLMVAYALAAKYPQYVEKLAVMDAFIPGIGPGNDIYNSPNIWHFRFNGSYPEQLVEGRERLFFDSLWEGFSAVHGVISELKKQYYVAQYSRPGRMRAGFAYFKAMPQDAADNKQLSQQKLQMPVLALGGEKSMGQALIATMQLVAQSVQGIVVKDCGHWMLEERPDETIKSLALFL
jgi:pimeloyl-ACP methyl ester carboxylesterase